MFWCGWSNKAIYWQEVTIEAAKTAVSLCDRVQTVSMYCCGNTIQSALGIDCQNQKGKPMAISS